MFLSALSGFFAAQRIRSGLVLLNISIDGRQGARRADPQWSLLPWLFQRLFLRGPPETFEERMFPASRLRKAGERLPC